MTTNEHERLIQRQQRLGSGTFFGDSPEQAILRDSQNLAIDHAARIACPSFGDLQQILWDRRDLSGFGRSLFR